MQVSPKQLEFESPLTKPATTNITVSNDSSSYIAFKVKTTAPKLYCVRPNAATIAPGESMDVSIIFQGLEKEPAMGTKCKDKFLIVSVPCEEGLDSKVVSNIWSDLQKNAGSTSDIKLKVVYNFDNMVNSIQEESSQLSISEKKDIASDVASAAVAAAAAVAATTDSKVGEQVSKAAKSDAAPVVDENTPLTSDSTQKTTTAVATQSSSSNIYIVAILLVLIAFLLKKFVL